MPDGMATRSGSTPGDDSTNVAGARSLTRPQRTTRSVAVALSPTITTRMATAKKMGKRRIFSWLGAHDVPRYVRNARTCKGSRVAFVGLWSRFDPTEDVLMPNSV